MKAAVLVKHGKAAQAFELKEVPQPEMKANEVLIKVEAFGLNYADVMARNGLYREAPPLPSIIGYDVVGYVEAQGDEVKEQLVGKRVVALTRFGGYAEYVATDTRGVAVISESLSVGEATALATQYCTAWYAGCEMVNLYPGDNVLIHAAAGGVGTALTQIAKYKGCTVFGTAGSEHKFDYLKQNGVDHIINYRTSDYSEEIQKILGPDGRLDVAFNSLAGKTLKKDRKLLGSSGRSVCYGGAERSGKKGGIFSTIGFLLNSGFINPLFLMMLSKGVIGVNMLKVADNKPSMLKRSMESVIDGTEKGWLKPAVGKTYTADEIAEAHAFLESRQSVGKIVVKW